jgi:membrane protein DedA with SNARE-associated domain
MNTIFEFVVQHGYSILFAAVFARQIGLPVPANLFVLAAGALAATGHLRVLAALSLAVMACVIADWIWFEAGRLRGERVLHFLHQFARDPDAADRNAKEHFERFGPPILVLAKFVPGLDLVAPPMAGTARTSRVYFFAMESAGAVLWASTYITLGHVFSHDLNRAVIYAGRAGTILAVLAICALIIYAGFKALNRNRRNRASAGLETLTEAPTPVTVPSHSSCRLLEGFNNGD